jgi:hypothetical protein
LCSIDTSTNASVALTFTCMLLSHYTQSTAVQQLLQFLKRPATQAAPQSPSASTHPAAAATVAPANSAPAAETAAASSTSTTSHPPPNVSHTTCWQFSPLLLVSMPLALLALACVVSVAALLITLVSIHVTCCNASTLSIMVLLRGMTTYQWLRILTLLLLVMPLQCLLQCLLPCLLPCSLSMDRFLPLLLLTHHKQQHFHKFPYLYP